MIAIESGSNSVNRGIDEVPITHWPAGELWDIPNLLDADQPLLGQVVLPRPTRIPVEERVRSIEQEIRQKLVREAAAERKRAQAEWTRVYHEKVAEKQAQEAQWERGYRAAQATQAHERKMAEMAARLQEKEAAAREREQLLATQQELSLFRQAQRTIESERGLIQEQRQREAIEAMRRPRPPITPVTPPAKTRPETPATPATPLPDVVSRPRMPAAPSATTAVPALMPKRAFVTEPARPVAPPVQRITGGGAPVPIRAAAPAPMAHRATQEAAYQMQMSRMYPAAGDMQMAREQQIRAAQMSGLGQYPRRTRIIPGQYYQPRRPTQAQIQAAQRQRTQAARRRPVTPPPQRPRGQTVMRQPPTRSRVMRQYQPPRQVRASERAATPQPRAAPARPRTGLTAARRTTAARRSPIPKVTQDIISRLRRYA